MDATRKRTSPDGGGRAWPLRGGQLPAVVSARAVQAGGVPAVLAGHTAELSGYVSDSGVPVLTG